MNRPGASPVLRVPLADGTLALPRLVSHAADAPYLGEAAIAYFLTVQPAPGTTHVPALGVPALARIGVAVFLGVPLLAWALAGRALWRLRPAPTIGRVRLSRASA